MTVCDQCLQLFDGLADICQECKRENEDCDYEEPEEEPTDQDDSVR